MKTNMKKLPFIISAALLSAASLTLNAAKPQAASEPAIEFAQTSHDFGTIAEKGGPVKHEFIFTNTGPNTPKNLSPRASRVKSKSPTCPRGGRVNSPKP